MKIVIEKTVDLDLAGTDGNAFAIMGAFRRQAQREGWPDEEITAVLTEAKSSDYDHLLATIINHCEVTDEDEPNTEDNQTDTSSSSKLKKVYAIFLADVEEEYQYIVTTQPTSFFDTEEEAQEELERICEERDFERNELKVMLLWKIIKNE